MDIRERLTSQHAPGTGQSEKNQSLTWQQKLKRHNRKRLVIGILIFICILIAAYTAVAINFRFHFYSGTVIYGVDCSQATKKIAKEEVEKKLRDFELQLEERNGRVETISAKAIDLAFVDDDSIGLLLKMQRSYIWPYMMLQEHSQMTSVAFSYSRDRAIAALNALDCMDDALADPPKDACIEATAEAFVVAPEDPGTLLDHEKAQEAVLNALDAGASSVSLDEEGCYYAPSVYQDDKALNEEAEKMNELATARISYDFGDRTEVVNPLVMQDWITRATNGEFVFDDLAVMSYVESLAKKYDTWETVREFDTTIGTTVTLIGGDYGWLMDQEATTVDLLKALVEGYQGSMEPEYTYTAMCRDTDDIGDTYIEICISLQEMWFYQDGECLVDTPVVTGNPNLDNGTPSNAVWKIDDKQRNATLVGENYEAPVDYWLPFNGSIGIHDLQTRYYFGGTIYLTNGSHGCINTPYEAVQTIYNAVSIGTPVVVYD